jgi:hypothetical protein
MMPEGGNSLLKGQIKLMNLQRTVRKNTKDYSDILLLIVIVLNYQELTPCRLSWCADGTLVLEEETSWLEEVETDAPPALESNTTPNEAKLEIHR